MTALFDRQMRTWAGTTVAPVLERYAAFDIFNGATWYDVKHAWETSEHPQRQVALGLLSDFMLQAKDFLAWVGTDLADSAPGAAHMHELLTN